MYDNPRSLLDEIALVHGPREVLGRYFAIADAMARNCGVRLRLRTDFDALMDLNRANRATWPPLPPICDPSYSTLGADNAFWLDGVNDHGETVVTYFARLFDFVDTNLVEAIRSLRIYYDDPTPHAAAGEMVEIDAPSAAVVCGRTVYGGGMWIRRDWRGTGLPKFMSRVCSAYAHTRWNTAFCWGFVVPRAHALGLSRAYGPYHAVEDLLVRLAFRGDLPTVLLWMHSETMLADLARIVDDSAIDNPRQRYSRHKSLAAGAMPRQ